MKYRKLGNSGILVSEIGLGTNNFGRRLDYKESEKITHHCLDLGINLLDTADMYSAGVSEEYIGKATKDNRDKYIIATKVGMKWEEGVNKGGLSSVHIKRSVEQSLKRLQSDYIDLYQTHIFDPQTNQEETLKALNDLVSEGKVRYIGISNETAWGTNQYIRYSGEKKITRIVSIQNAYNFLNRGFEVDLSEIAIREKVGLLAYSPLASGYLSGKYRNDAMPKNSRMDLFYDFWPRYRTINSEKAIEEYWNLAKNYNLNLAQMAIKFCELQPFITSVIIGATTMEQLKSNIDSVNINLNKEIIKKIGEIQKRYPNPCP